MNERRIKGRVVGVENTLDGICYTLLLEGDDKGRRVLVPVPPKKYGVQALLNAAFFYGFVVSMTATYDKWIGVMLVNKVKDVKVEDDQ